MADSAISDLVNNGTLSPTDLVELARSPFSSGDSVSTELSYLRMYVLRPDADWREHGREHARKADSGPQ